MHTAEDADGDVACDWFEKTATRMLSMSDSGEIC